jgi:hypothetical protein
MSVKNSVAAALQENVDLLRNAQRTDDNGRFEEKEESCGDRIIGVCTSAHARWCMRVVYPR